MAGGTVGLVIAGDFFDARIISQMIKPMATGTVRMNSKMIQCQILKLPMCPFPDIDSSDQAPNT